MIVRRAAKDCGNASRTTLPGDSKSVMPSSAILRRFVRVVPAGGRVGVTRADEANRVVMIKCFRSRLFPAARPRL